MSSKLRTEIFPASGTIVTGALNNFVMLVQTAAAVTVRFYRDGTSFEAENIEAGYVKGLRKPWDRMEITGAAGSTVRFLLGMEEITDDFTDYRRTVGVFQAQQPSEIADAADIDVGGVAGPVAVAPANASRYSITFTNLDSSAAYVRIGNLATVAAGRGQILAPGASVTSRVTGAIYAIRETAAAALVGVSEENY